MNTKIFDKRDEFELVGDIRGFTVPSKDRVDYWSWCQSNDIVTEYQCTLGDVDLWYVKNDEHRMWALLRWS